MVTLLTAHYGSQPFKLDKFLVYHLVTDSEVYCTTCERLVNVIKYEHEKQCLVEHLNGKKHKQNARQNRMPRRTLPSMFNAQNAVDEFNYKLVNAFIFKLNHLSLRSFFDLTFKKVSVRQTTPE